MKFEVEVDERRKKPKVIDDSVLADGAQNHSKVHELRRKTIFEDFCLCLKKKGVRGEMLDMVVDEDNNSVPRMLTVFRNEGEEKNDKTRRQIKVLNKMLVDWQALTMKRKPGTAADYCPYYQPSVQNQRL